MKVTINKSIPRGQVAAPPSKSMAHRLLICAALAEGHSTVRGISPSQDVLATLDCLGALGVTCTYEGDTVFVEGIGRLRRGQAGDPRTLPCRESGSTLRFFLPLCMQGERVVLTGSETLLGRPLTVYEELCAARGIFFSNDGARVTVEGKLTAGDFCIPGDISSQFVSGLLFALPLLPGDSTIRLLPPVESRSYIDLTLDALGQFGVSAVWQDENTLWIKGDQHYVPRDVTVEGDYSGAAFFAAMDALGGDVRVTGLREESLQGDRVYRRHLDALCAGRATVDLSDCPDLGPVLFAVAAAKHGGLFTGTRRLRIKESDRGAAMAQELGKFGVSVNVGEDTVVVDPVDFHRPDTVTDGHNDHRIVMSLAVLLTLTGGQIEGAEAVRKSMPDFFEKLQELGVDTIYETV